MSKRYNSSSADGLCCCEYIDNSGKSNHILACCCDCSAIDSACDRVLECQKIPSTTLVKMFTTIEDRLRIPWFNGKGAVKINLDVAIPVVVVPLGLLIGTLHSAFTILVMVFIPLSLFTTYRVWLRQKRKSRTKFFYSWGVTSVIQMYLTFQIVVVSYREILLWENMLLHTLMFGMFYAFYHAKKDPGIIRRTVSQDMMNRLEMVQNHNFGDTNTKHEQDFNRSNMQSKTDNNEINFKAPCSQSVGCEDEACQSKSCKQDSKDSTDENFGSVGTLMMQNFGFSKDVLQECVEDHKRKQQESSHVIPAQLVSWVDSRMIADGRVAMWCKHCRLVKPPRTGHCPVCNVCIQSRDHHCIWIDNCIGANNHRSFVLAVLLFVMSGSYGLHLTLSTICTPVIYWSWLLVPNDCRFLYADFPTALCFVSVVYSICAVIGMSAVLLTQCLLISQNITSHEMHTATFRNWVRCGVCATHNSLTKGCINNILSFFKGERTWEQKYGTGHTDCDCV